MSASFTLRRGYTSLPPPDPSQRPFDALVSFMPAGVPDKALLKHSILVTTISRPLLTSSLPASPAAARQRTNSNSNSRPNSSASASARPRPRSIFGAFSQSASSVYLSPTPPYQSGESLSLPQAPPPPPGKALLVHLLPPAHAHTHPSARRKLVDSMESFLVSYAFQDSPVGLPSSSGEGPLERARPYVMQATTFCDAVGCEPGVADFGDWTVADVVLSGALDADTPPSSPGPSSSFPSSPSAAGIAGARKAARPRRAWVAAAADLVIMPSGPGEDPTSPAGATPAGHGISRSRTESSLDASSPATPAAARTRSASTSPQLARSSRSHRRARAQTASIGGYSRAAWTAAAR